MNLFIIILEFLSFEQREKKNLLNNLINFLEFNDLRLQKKKGRNNFALETSETLQTEHVQFEKTG